MGLFNRSKKKKQQEEPKTDASDASSRDGSVGGEEPDLSAFDGLDANRPRCRHYVFAHVALRQVAFDYPIEVVAALGSEKADALIDDLWQSVEKACTEREDDDATAVDRSAIQIHRVRIGKFPTAVIQMPQPQGATEAYFTAIVLCIDPEASGYQKEDIPVRYFTLEFGAKMSSDEPDRTVLCEWDAAGSHLNLGDGPPAELSMFTDALKAKLG